MTIRHGRISYEFDVKLEISNYISAVRKRSKLNQIQQKVTNSKSKFNFTSFSSAIKNSNQHHNHKLKLFESLFTGVCVSFKYQTMVSTKLPNW